MEAQASITSDNTRSTSARIALAILFLVVTLNLFDRQLINILAQDIKVDLALSDAELGLLTGTAFGLLKALFSIPISAWADRAGRPRILAWLIGLCSAFCLLCGAANGFTGLALSRMGVGVGESAGVPIASAMVRDHFPRRSTSALALAMAGNPVGTFLAFLVGGAIAERWGWRWAFLAAGPPGLLLAWVVVRNLGDVGAPARSSSLGPSWIQDSVSLVRRPLIKPLIWATTGSMFMVSAANAWMPAFFIRAHHMGTAEAGLFGAIAIGVGGALGALSGIACDLARPSTKFAESAMMRGTLLLAFPSLLTMVFGRDAGWALAAFLIYNMLAYAWLAPTIRLIQDCAEPHQRALAIALCGAIGMFVGLGLGLPLIGWISDLITPSYGARAIGLALCFVVSAAIVISLVSHEIVLSRLKIAQAGEGRI